MLDDRHQPQFVLKCFCLIFLKKEKGKVFKIIFFPKSCIDPIHSWINPTYLLSEIIFQPLDLGSTPSNENVFTILVDIERDTTTFISKIPSFFKGCLFCKKIFSHLCIQKNPYVLFVKIG